VRGQQRALVLSGERRGSAAISDKNHVQSYRALSMLKEGPAPTFSAAATITNVRTEPPACRTALFHAFTVLCAAKSYAVWITMLILSFISFFSLLAVYQATVRFSVEKSLASWVLTTESAFLRTSTWSGCSCPFGPSSACPFWRPACSRCDEQRCTRRGSQL
jgi:hypothetical protein